MKPLLALLVLILLAGCVPVPAADPVTVCRIEGAQEACSTHELSSVQLEGAGARVIRRVEVAPGELPLVRPLMVRVIALASSDVRWNGVLIGRNGVPGATPEAETPGRFVASFIVPARLVRPGENLLSVRMSAQHLWLPVRTPIHVVDAVPYPGPDLPGRSNYLPALLTLGALAAAFAYFAAAGWGQRGSGQARLLAGIAAAAMLQLLIEVARAFIGYTYPWHLARVAAIAFAAASIAVLIAAYAAGRFAPSLRTRLVGGTFVVAGASLLFVPWYDLKALAAILAGLVALLVAARRGLKQRRPAARVALAAALATIALMLVQRTSFLDQAWYLALAVTLVALVAEQVAGLRRLRAERDAEALRSAALAERLARAEREGEPIVALKDGARTHRIAEGDIVYARAADDYCEAALKDGRTLLVTMTLGRLLKTLPERFVRVHKSYVVNRVHVTSVAPRPGGGRVLNLSDGSSVPVGRSYGSAVSALIG